MPYNALHEAELAFRLAQLRRRYPGYISQSMANDFIASGGNMEWQQHPDFVAQTSQGMRSERGAIGGTNTSASFGGGSSSGGGGGGW